MRKLTGHWVIFHLSKLPKNQFLVSAGEIPAALGFVVSGILRLYYISDSGSEFTKSFCVEGNVVGIRFITTAKHTGNFMGAPATNHDLNIGGIFMRKIKGGKVIQEWQTTDLLGTMSQMGFGTLMAYAIFNVLFKPKKK